MVTKLKTLIVLLLLSLTSFSQKDTTKICFPYYKAKQIAIDLVKGDSAIAELKVVNKLVWQLNEKIDTQDSIITLYVAKETNYIAQIDNYEKINVVKDKIITGLESDVEKLNRKNERLKKGFKWLGGGFVASILTIITLVTIK
jgi:hypothetical protein